jgi:non-ribosomal peptide synthetase component F
MAPAERLALRKAEGIPMTLHRMLEEQASRDPLRSALLAPGRKPISYRRLLRQCEQIVSQLNAAGIGRGDRLAVVLSMDPRWQSIFSRWRWARHPLLEPVLSRGRLRILSCQSPVREP